MSEKDIEDRLRSHAKAFDSLLNLIPAKLYFTQDNSDQWKKRKQTKEESQAAKRAKLDPDQAVTVKEVEDEKARERSAREEKRRKLNEDGASYETKSQMKARKKEEKRRERREKREKREKDPNARENKVQTDERARDDDDDGNDDGMELVDEEEQPTPKKASHPPRSPSKQAGSPKKEQHHPAKRKDAKPNGVQLKVNGTDKTGKVSIIQKPTVESSDSSDGDDDDDEEDITADMDEMAQGSSDSEDNSEASDSEGESIQRIPGLVTEPITASSPSPAPSNTTDTSTTQKSLAEKLKTSKDPIVQQQLKERLAKRIEELRQARKADGGEVPRTRTELMEQRRKRDEQRKERKKQMRLQAKVEAQKAQGSTETTTQTADGKKSQSKKATAPANYAFGNVNFADGEKLTADLGGIKTAGRKKGPSDVLGALKHAEAKKARLAGMSEEKRADIQEKDRWSKALKMASGEKLQDDEGLLKKSLKRQEKAKKKSEREWKERNESVEKAKAMRQKKREANLAARKEQKKSGKGGKKPRKVPSKKSKGRAGFEGTGFGGAGKKRK